MGLGQLLLKYATENQDKIEMDIVASDFLDIYIGRCQTGKPQLATKGRFTYIEQEIHKLNAGKTKREESLEIVKSKALIDMVLQRFNNLNGRSIREPFYSLTDNSQYLILNPNLLSIANLPENVELLEGELLSRWDLLEHAYERSNNIESLDVDLYNAHIIKAEQRTNLTKLIPTLIGYQQNRCFYCGEELFDIAVDHVIPFQALMHNDMWNLVLAHDFCNELKSDNIPPWHFVENLITRNEYFISSAHPIKDTLIRQLGSTRKLRKQKVVDEYHYAKGKIGRIWEGNPNYDPRKDAFYRRCVTEIIRQG
jgi:hypothetical protein